MTSELTILSDDAGTTAGPDVTLHRDSTSPAAADLIGRVNFDGGDSSTPDPVQTTYASIEAQIDDTTDTSEDGTLLVRTMQDGTLTTAFDVSTKTVFSQDVDVNGSVGIGTSSPDGPLHVQSGSAGSVTASTEADDIVIENSGNVGLSFLSPSTSSQAVYFGDADSNIRGYVQYTHGDDELHLGVGGSDAMRCATSTDDPVCLFKDGSATNPTMAFINDLDTGAYLEGAGSYSIATGGTRRFKLDNSGAAFLNDSTNADMTIGLTINQGISDNQILALKSSTDVDHGMTTVVETDTFADFRKLDAPNGGLVIRALTQSKIAFQVTGNPTTVDTTDTVNSKAAVILKAEKKSGTSVGAMGSSDNLVSFENAGTTLAIIKGDGNWHGDTSWTALDEYDDAQLVRALDLERSSAGIIDSEFDAFIKDRRDMLEKAGIVSPDGADGSRGLVCYTRLWKLHNGAIWQSYVRENVICRLLDQMLPGFGQRLTEELQNFRLPALAAFREV